MDQVKQRALSLLRTAVGDASASFRDGQWEAVEALLNRERLLVVERTGWGKSIVYFLATRLLRERGAGCTLLISPLLALMRNQIAAAARIGVRAETVNSSNVDDWLGVERALHANAVDVLLVSPERLANEDFLTRCLLPVAPRVGLFVVDEAHCISDWGHDFRPDYRRIVRILRALPPNLPILATTATANDRVVGDIQQQLGPKLRTIRGPLTRETLRLQNLRLPTRAERMAWIAQHLQEMPGSGIVYTLTVRDALNLAGWLRSRGIDAEAYYGGMQSEDREALEERLLRNELKVLVATVALGMGFDKPDLGFVIHYQRPASVVHYYQQVGRAGRAIDQAYGVLLSGEEDDEIAEYFVRTAFPTVEEVDLVLKSLRASRVPLKAAALQQQANIPAGKLEKILKFLSLESPTPVQRTSAGYVLNPVPWQMPTERIERITNLRKLEQTRMRDYMNLGSCLMQFLSAELNDPQATSCGQCANCASDKLAAELPQELLEAATDFLGNLALPIEPRKMWPSGMAFEGMRGRIDPGLRAELGRALIRWGDPGLGRLVRSGKQDTHRFDERLVDAAHALIHQRWYPQPFPEWVTYVPSRRRITLVADFARRLAARFQLPLSECIHKVRETEPQKTRQNSYQQVRNLDGAFKVEAQIVRPGPVLLVDDMVDSRWTFTVLAAKLRQAGSGPVFPFALADTSTEDGD